MSGFNQALPFVLDMEGGYANHPSDPGGATNHGITQKTYNDWRVSRGLGFADVKQITRDEVEAIYYHRYWIDGRCDALPWPISLAHFDACVNHGIRSATKMLQAVVHVTQDGIIGPITAKAVAEENPETVLNELLWERLRYYYRICQNRPASKVFLLGWVRRLIHLRVRTRPAA